MHGVHIIKNIQPSIIYEVASTFGRTNNQPYGGEFFNQIVLRSFMVLAISAIAANLRVIAERLI